VLRRNPRLLTPPADTGERYPYARVWRGLVLLCGSTLLTALAFLVTALVGVNFERSLHAPLHFGLALLPAALWVVFAWLPERGVDDPRQGLEVAFVVTALVASGVTIPVLQTVLQTERWLPLADVVTRLVGYTTTLGVAQEISKYSVVRAVAWDNHLRVRVDAVAYCAAAALGYATAVLLNEALRTPAAPTAAALSMFSTAALSLAPSLLVAYGIGEARLGSPTPFLLLFVFALAALVFGVASTLRGALTNAALSLTVSAPTPLFGLAIAAAVLLLIGVSVALLIITAERREAQRRARE
jgi:hypothetical protein